VVVGLIMLIVHKRKQAVKLEEGDYESQKTFGHYQSEDRFETGL
jgi:hypothetical protein